MRALNVDGSLPSVVAKTGIKSLTERQRASVPSEIQPADDAYKARLRAAFEQHQSAKTPALSPTSSRPNWCGTKAWPPTPSITSTPTRAAAW